MTNHTDPITAIYNAAEAHRVAEGHTVYIIPDAGWVCSICDEDADEVIADFYAGEPDAEVKIRKA